jgi:hypothetical protein
MFVLFFVACFEYDPKTPTHIHQRPTTSYTPSSPPSTTQLVLDAHTKLAMMAFKAQRASDLEMVEDGRGGGVTALSSASSSSSDNNSAHHHPVHPTAGKERALMHLRVALKLVKVIDWLVD